MELSIYVIRVLVMRHTQRHMDIMMCNICYYEMWERLLIHERFGVKKFAEAVLSDVWSLGMQIREDMI